MKLLPFDKRRSSRRKKKSPPRQRNSTIREPSHAEKLVAAQRLRSTTPLKKKNAKRAKSEFARCFHSKARVEFVKSLPCVVCCGISSIFGLVTGRSDNAHTAKDGMGRRAGYETIVPLCRSHHRIYDDRQWPLADPVARHRIEACAPLIEAAWQRHVAGSHGGESPVSAWNIHPEKAAVKKLRVG